MSDSIERPSLTTLTYLGFLLNGFASDGGDKLTFDEVYDGLDNGTLWAVIQAKHPHMDLTMFTHVDKDKGAKVIQALLDAASGMRERERKKYGVEKSGLAILLAYVLEAIQQEYWVPASDSKYRAK
jgi:hypothetical protein